MKDEIKDKSIDFLGDLISSLQGDKIALARVAYTISSSPFFIREQLFWSKFRRFLDNVDSNLEDGIKFSQAISKDGKKEDNAKRIIQVIDSVESDKKVDYIINLSRSLRMGLIEISVYFRLMQAIRNLLIEDLNYLKDKMNKEICEDISNGKFLSIESLNLLNNGLIYCTNSNMHAYMGGNRNYKISSLGLELIRCGIDYNNYNIYKDSKMINSITDINTIDGGTF